MAKLEIYSCDHCGIQKTKANGWFRAIIKAGEYFLVSPWAFELEALLLPSRISAIPFDDQYEGSEQKHYCSESCVSKALSKSMGHSHD